MDWREFWDGLSPSKKRKYANDCGSTYEAMTTAYVYGDQIPRPEKMARMVVESDDRLPMEDAIEHFVTKKVRAEIQRLQKEENPANGV